MPSLGSTILQRDAASAAAVEEALTRQVLHGGDLATNLLELGALPEFRLHELVAEALELPAAPGGPIPRASAEARDQMRADVAERYACYPLELNSEALIIAVAVPLPVPVLNELQAKCGRGIVQQSALALRIREALARDFGVPLDRRYERIFALLAGKPDPHPTVPPDKRHHPAPAEVALIVPAPKSDTETSIFGSVAVASRPNAVATSGSTSDRRSMPDSAHLRLSRRPRHRGPYTVASAEEDLLNAGDRDDLLKAFFDFASQYFEYSAIFAVHGDIAEGRDAYGPGADRKRISAIGVPLDLPSILNSAWRSGHWQLTVLSPDGLNGNLARDLERRTGSVVAVIPVVVRQRVVILLYGDHGESDVQLEQLGDVIAFAPLVARALERILLQRKREMAGISSNFPAPPPMVEAVRSQSNRIDRMTNASGTIDIDVGPLQKAHRDLLDSLQAALPSPGSPPGHAESDGTGTHSESIEDETTISTLSDPSESRGLDTSHPSSIDGRNLDAIEGSPFALRPTNSLAEAIRQVGAPGSEAADSVETESHDTLLDSLLSVAPSRPETDVPPVGTAPHRDLKPAPAPERARDKDGHDPISERHDRAPEDAVESVDELPYLVEQLVQGDRTVLDQIVALGELALGNLIFLFPGPIHHEPPRPGANKASECGLLLEALVRIGAKSIPFVSVRTADAQPHVRQWATLVLGELPSPESVRAVLSRLGDREACVRQAATAAARQLLQRDLGRSLLEAALREMLGAQRDKATRLTAFEYLAELRTPFVVPMLLDLLESTDRDIARSAEWALGVLCRQTFGPNHDAWRDWWAGNRTRHRTEWLIDSLTHPQPAVRRAAAEELRSIAPPNLGYSDELPASELEETQERYRNWWTDEGKPDGP